MFGRLPHKKRKVLTLPELPRGYRWVLRKKDELGSYVSIERRWIPFVSYVMASTYGFYGETTKSREHYQKMVDACYKDFTKKRSEIAAKDYSWQPDSIQARLSK